MQGPMACGSQWDGAVWGFHPDDGGGVTIAHIDAKGGGLRLVREVGWLAFEVGRQVHEPQHFDGAADRVVLLCGLSSSVRRGAGRVHVADDDGAREHGHLAVCFGQGLEERFRRVAEEDVGVDDVELPSVPDDLVDAQSPLDAEVVDEGGRGCRLGRIGGSPCASSICMLSGPRYILGWVLEGRRVAGLSPGR